MSKLFNAVTFNRPKKTKFDLGHERKFSAVMGNLTPILCEEVVPGDSFKNASEFMVRLAPLMAPVMHRMDVHTHYFFVPYRLIWEDSQKFFTGGENGLDEPVMPHITFERTDSAAKYIQAGSLADYLGFSPPANDTWFDVDVNTLPFRAYNLIWNEFYRDQNLQEEIEIYKGSGNEPDYEGNFMKMRKRNWEKDYFTSALPWTQKGGSVRLPMSGTAHLEFTSGTTLIRKESGHPAGYSNLESNSAGELEGMQGAVKIPANLDVSDNHVVDLSSATAATIEELRRATRLQRWLERNARGGSRYIEQILSHFGVKSSDSRLQRPEFLGGGRSPITISEVLQTSSSDETTPQANMAGHGISIGSNHGFKKSFEEHGLVIGLMSIMPRISYISGSRRFFYKKDRFDFLWPEFANLGEQAVLNGELYSSYNENDLDTFGYQSRYAEYKYIPSTCHGDFRNNLDHWHMARKFENAPTLSSEFVECENITRIWPVEIEDNPTFYCSVYNNLQAIRPLPFLSNPTL